MQLSDYFEFEKIDTPHGVAERIRIKGHRIALEHVIEPFNLGVEPRVIQQQYFPSLTLEEVYATITYYLQNQAAVDEYLRQGAVLEEAYHQEYLKRGPYFLRDMAASLAQKAVSARGNDAA